jgi:tetratricopeptide (TPR) repeat protein
MEPGEILVGLKLIINTTEFDEVIFSLHQDPKIWEKVSEENFLEEFSKLHGNEPGMWNPGLIGLFSIYNDSLQEVISTDPLLPIPSELRQQASTFYQKALKSGFIPSTLAESTYLALALRERKRLTGNWTGLLSEIVRSSVDHTIRPETWLTSFAVLVSWFAQDQELLKELMLSQEHLTENGFYEFITGILLVQQKTFGEKKDTFYSLLIKEDFTHQVNWIRYISEIRPVLAQDLANQIISSYQDQPEFDGQTPNGAYNHFLQDLARQSKSTDPLVSEEFDPDFTSLDQWITLFGISKDDQQYNALLDYKKELLQIIQAGIQAYKLRKSIPTLSIDEEISAWQEISLQSPQSDVAKAEFVLSKLGSGQAVNSKDIVWSQSEEPLVLLTRALISKTEGEVTTSKELAQHAIEKSLEKKSSNLKDIERYIKLLSELGYPDLSKSYLHQLTRKNISQPGLYRMLAQIDDQIGNRSEAINEANIALSLNGKDRVSRRLIAKLYKNNGDSTKALEAWDKVLNDDDPIEPINTQDYIEYSKCAISMKLPDLAIEACQKTLDSEPANGDIYCILGDAYSLKGDPIKSAEYFQNAVALSPEQDQPWIKLVEYKNLSENKEAVLDLLSTAINACPNSAKLASMFGDYYIEEGSYSESIPYLRKAYGLEPAGQYYALKFGSTLQMMGQPEEAISVFRDALSITKEDPELLSAYTNVLLACEKYEESVEPLLQIIAQHPVDIKPYIDLATIALSLKDSNNPLINLESIENILEEGLLLDPQNYQGRLLEAELFAALGRAEDAQDIYINLSEDINLPADVRWKVNYGLGMTSTKLGKMDIALAALEEAGLQNPQNFEIHQKLAETYSLAKLPKAAMESAQAALAISPTNPENLIWYSEFCTNLGDIPEALSSLDAAIKHQPEKAELRLKLGELQLKMKDISAAKKTFQDLVAHGKLNSNLIRRVSKNLVDAGEIDEAIQYLEFGIELDPVSSLPLLLDLVNYEEKNGNLSKAVTAIERAISINLENIDLQILKADLLAHSGQYESAISTLEDALTTIEQKADDTQENKSFEIFLRMAYLNRKNGNLAKAIVNVQDALGIKSVDSEALYLGADLSFNILDFAKAGEFLQQLFSTGEALSKPVSFLGEILDALVKRETTSDPSAHQALMNIELPAKWSLMQTAVDILTHSVKTVSPEYDLIFNEISGHNSKDIYSLLPSGDIHSENLPQVNVYDPVASSPSMLLMIANSALMVNHFQSANSLIDTLANDFTFEPSVQLYRLKLLTLQAEAYRFYSQLKIKKHLPSGDVLSITALDQFNETLLNTKRYSESEIIHYWETRGNAAFQPNKENLESLIQFNDLITYPESKLQKYALENNVAELEGLVRNDPHAKGLEGYAATLIAEKAPVKAFELIENIIDNVDSNPISLSQIALVSNFAGEYEIALSSIEKALEKWPNEPDWHSFAAQICKKLDNPSSALYHLKIAADLEPQNFDSILAFGEGCLDLGDPNQAIQYLKVASSIEPANYRPWLLLAKTYQSRGDNLQAMSNIERSVTLAPNNVEPLLLSAELSFINGQPDQTIKKVDAAIRLDPKNVEALVIKVRALRAVEQSEEAMKLIHYAIKKVSKPLPLLIEKAEIIRSQEGEKAYLNTLQKIVDDYPKSPEILRLYSLSLAENGFTSEALNITQLSLKLNPDQYDMHILAGRLLRVNGQLDQALDHLSEAITQDPANIDGYLELAKTYQERRDFAKAISIYKQAIEVMPKDYRPYYQLGIIMKESKDYRGAENMLRKAAEFSKDDVNILRQLGAIIAINLVHPS